MLVNNKHGGCTEGPRGEGRVLDDTRGESTMGCETSREKVTRGERLGGERTRGGDGLGEKSPGFGVAWSIEDMFSCNFIKYCLSVRLLRCFPKLVTLGERFGGLI